MRETVKSAWPTLCTQYEGRCYWLYLDTLKLTTTGLGYRVVDFDSMRSLPWYTKAGELANQTDVFNEWAYIKSQTKLAPKGGFAFKSVSSLHLNDDEVDKLLFVTTNSYWSIMVKTLPDLESWPADAQLAIMDMAWNLGPYFLGSKWPNFTKAAKSGDFASAASSCLRAVKSARDYRHQNLFLNAAKVVLLGLDKEVLWDTKTPVANIPNPDPKPTAPITTPGVTVKHSNTYDCDYVWYGKGGGHSGGWVPTNLVEVLDAAAKETGKPIYLSQGGLNGTVSASAKTHMGLGAFDIAIDGRSKDQVWALASVLLRCGIVAFPRGYTNDSFQNMKHIHCASWDNYDSLHPQAQHQVDVFRSGRKDGLAYNHSYTGPSTILEHWKTSPFNSDNIKKQSGTMVVQTKTLVGLDVDRNQKKTRDKGYEVDYTRLIKRWDRWNAVTSQNTYYAVSDGDQVFLKPKEDPKPPVVVPAPPVVDPPVIPPVVSRDGTRGD